MKTEIPHPGWEEIIFESRNRAYGAYVIRKSYDKNMAKALVTMILFASVVFGVLQVAPLMQPKMRIPHPDLPPPKPMSPPRIIPDPPRSQSVVKPDLRLNKAIAPLVVTHPEMDKPQERPAEVSNVGTEMGKEVASIDDNTSGSTANLGVVAPELTNKIFDSAEFMPEYVGGVRAMMKFLQKNVHYPSTARRIGIEGTVFVRFIVNTRGEVTNLEIFKGVNAVLDNEAMRVIAMMPPWKPGRQHDSLVSVRMVLPIKFKLEE